MGWSMIMNAWQEREDIAIIDFELNQTSNNKKKNKAAGENQFQFNFSGLNFFRAGNLRSFNRDENLLIKNIKKVGKFWKFVSKKSLASLLKSKNKLLDGLQINAYVYVVACIIIFIRMPYCCFCCMLERNKRKLSWRWIKLPHFPSFSLPHFSRSLHSTQRKCRMFIKITTNPVTSSEWV